MRIPKVIAHRGGRQWAPENTLAAFRRSVELGVDGIELDVHRCATGELVVIHDEDLNRTTNGAGFVKDASYAELAKLSAGLWYGKEFADEYIPLLKEVLELVDGRMIINIELKNTPIEYPGIEEDLLSLIEGYQRKDTLIISSFDHKVMRKLHELAPSLNTALLAAALFIDIKEYAAKMGARFFHPALDCLRADGVEEAHAAGLFVSAWTCNTQRDWQDAIDMGVDGIVTDDPQGLIAYLEHLSTAFSPV